MRKTKKLILFVMLLACVVCLSACIQSITCISHIDRDEDGRCDNCHQKVGEVEHTNVESISVKVEPSKTYYALNVDKELDISGGIINVIYNDGTPSEDLALDAEGVSVTAPSLSSKGTKMVSIKYKGKTTSYNIEVGEPRYKVSFNLGYTGAPSIADQYVIIKEKATAPANPSRDGYDFGGWFEDQACTKAFDFAAVDIMQDTELFASWIRKFVVTYNANYAGGQNITRETVGGKAPSDVTPAERAGYKFAGWYSDAGCSSAFSFNSDITADTTVYAKWVTETVTFHTVTFNSNYGEVPTTTTASVADGDVVAQPASPTRANVTEKGHVALDFTFGGWYTDKACSTAYNFNNAVTADMELYAKWTGTYIFEAEHVDFYTWNEDEQYYEPMHGMGASGGADGANMVDSPAPGQEGIDASNGYYVTYLFSPGLGLTFAIDSDRDVDNVTFIFRISCENSGYALDPVKNEGYTASGTLYSCYTISCNDEAIAYNTIEITDAQGHEDTGGKRPFSDHVITTTLSLKKGVNYIKCITNNDHGMGGTMAGTAPVIDCIKLVASAELSWSGEMPFIDNEFGQ